VQRANPTARDGERCTIYAVGDTVVWSFRRPSLPPAPYLPNSRPAPAVPLVAAAVPLVSEGTRAGIAERYMQSDRNRALALGRNKAESWATGDSDAEAIRRALQSCGHSTGRPCFIYAIGDQVVVRVPQKFRPVDVFTPQDLADLEPAQREAVERYLVADDWRAIAVGRNGRIGIATGQASEDVAVEVALRDCVRVGGTDCAVSTVGPFLVTRN
jgi:adenylate cyclase